MRNRISAFALLGVVATAFGCNRDPVAPESDVRPTLAVARVDLCHLNGNGTYQLLNVGNPGLAAHLSHGDGQPGTPYPGAFGKKFGTDCSPVNANPDFITFYIRNFGGSITSPWDADMVLTENAAGDGYSFSTPRSGQKVGYGTNFFDGQRINQLESVNWTHVLGMNGGIITYLNMWVTDGNGNYAVIASENQYPGTNFLTRTEWKVFEFGPTSDLNWLFPAGTTTAGRVNQYLQLNGVNVTLAQLADNIVIGDPGAYGVGVGTGAPRGGFGLNLIWGDTQSNFTQPVIGQMKDLTVTVAGVTYAASNP